MRFRQFIILLPLLWWGAEVRAQVPDELSSMPEQWQLTLDVIKSKAQHLVVENNGLQVEYRQLIDQAQQLRQAIDDQQHKNQQMSDFLKQRHGQTDQQARIEELTQTIRTKKLQAKDFDGQLGNLKTKRSDVDHKIQSLKYTISDIELHQQSEKDRPKPFQTTATLPVDDQLAQLRLGLEDENKQEVLLENELGALKTGDQAKNLNADALDAQNKELEARLDVLRLQKLEHEKKSSDMVVAQANGRMYAQLKSRKEELEANIYAYETRMDELKQTSLMALSWPIKKKQLIHDMVQTDARNNQMRDKIKVLREDIDVLRDQVARLERRVDFVKGPDIK